MNLITVQKIETVTHSLSLLSILVEIVYNDGKVVLIKMIYTSNRARRN